MIAGKYLVQYTFAAIGSAVIVPLIDEIGIGLASTIGKSKLLCRSSGDTICADKRPRCRFRHNRWLPHPVDSKKWIVNAAEDGK